VSPMEALARKYKPVRRLAQFLIGRFDLPEGLRKVLAGAASQIPFDQRPGPSFRRDEGL
jgi:hypothetical protein